MRRASAVLSTSFAVTMPAGGLGSAATVGQMGLAERPPFSPAALEARRAAAVRVAVAAVTGADSEAVEIAAAGARVEIVEGAAQPATALEIAGEAAETECAVRFTGPKAIPWWMPGLTRSLARPYKSRPSRRLGLAQV